MPDPAELRKGLQKAKKEKVNFAFCVGGTADDLIVSKRPIKPAEGKAMKSQQGGRLVTGTCEFKDGKLWLSIEKGRANATLPKSLRKLIKDSTRLSWKVEVNEGTGEEGEAEEEDGDDNEDDDGGGSGSRSNAGRRR